MNYFSKFCLFIEILQYNNNMIIIIINYIHYIKRHNISTYFIYINSKKIKLIIN